MQRVHAFTQILVEGFFFVRTVTRKENKSDKLVETRRLPEGYGTAPETVQGNRLVGRFPWQPWISRGAISVSRHDRQISRPVSFLAPPFRCFYIDSLGVFSTCFATEYISTRLESSGQKLSRPVFYPSHRRPLWIGRSFRSARVANRNDSAPTRCTVTQRLERRDFRCYPVESLQLYRRRVCETTAAAKWIADNARANWFLFSSVESIAKTSIGSSGRVFPFRKFFWENFQLILFILPPIQP